MNRILIIIQTMLPKRFTRKQFNIVIRQHSSTIHPGHHLQRLVQSGKLKHNGQGIYSIV